MYFFAQAEGEHVAVDAVLQILVVRAGDAGQVDADVAGRLGCISEEVLRAVYLKTVEYELARIGLHLVVARIEKAACCKQNHQQDDRMFFHINFCC